MAFYHDRLDRLGEWGASGAALALREQNLHGSLQRRGIMRTRKSSCAASSRSSVSYQADSRFLRLPLDWSFIRDLTCHLKSVESANVGKPVMLRVSTHGGGAMSDLRLVSESLSTRNIWAHDTKGVVHVQVHGQRDPQPTLG